jgi:hypothetical protein
MKQPLTKNQESIKWYDRRGNEEEIELSMEMKE